ncbi:MAG: cytochrome c biogenesis protein CcsA [Deinococcales bacterium]
MTDDFSVYYVAKHSSVFAPLWVKVVMLWGALEGSILLWGFLLSAYAAILALSTPNHPLRPWALVIINVVLGFFVLVIGFVANPFKALNPAEFLGPGPNPLLQNHWMMAVHPMLMYLGFVGLTVPFAFALAALITKRPGSEWMRLTRRWTLTGWGFLTAAIIAGGWWSYEVLGWGGYWAWDPVENVSFMPWLTATAFIHSVQVQERRRMLKSWNMLLIVLTFALSILGTFLTRSGVLSSVHAFGDGPVGPFFLGFFILVMAASLILVVLRWDQLRDNSELDAIVSREGSFLAGNVLFLTMTFAVLLGTLFPLIVEAISGDKVTVGAPFFNQMSIPLWLLIFALMGIGPLLPWRKAESQSLRRNLMYLLAAALISGFIAYLLGMRKIYPLLTVAWPGYNLMSLWLLLAGAIMPRAKLSQRVW